MDNCEQYRDWIMESLSGELPEENRGRLMEHLKGCTECRAEYRELEAMLAAVSGDEAPEMAEEFWYGYWDKLSDRLKPKRRPFSRFFVPGWTMIPAAAALLVAGVLIGRFFFSSQPTDADRMQSSTADRGSGESGTFQYALGDYFQDLEPLLIDWSSREEDAGKFSGETVVVDRALLERLLMQNTLFKRALSRSGDTARKELLENLEVILLEMTGSPSDPRSISGVGRMISDNDLLLKMRVMGRSPRSV